MTEKFRLEPVADMSQWDAVVSKSPQGTLFHTRRWIELSLGQKKDISFEPLGFFVGDELAGVFPLFIEHKFGLRFASSVLPFSGMVYGGPVWARSGEQRHRKDHSWSSFIQSIDSYIFGTLGASYSYIRTSFPFEDTRPFRHLGYSSSMLYTFVVDTSRPTDTLWNNFHQSTRTAIRKAEASGIKISASSDPKDLEGCHSMLEETYERSGIAPPLCESDFSAICTSLLNEKMATLFSAESEGNKLAFALVPFFHKTAYYWLGASSSAGWKLRPMNLLHWEVIKWANKKGLSAYDMIGANQPGNSSFKATYDPALFHYFEFKKYSNPLIHAFERLYLMRRSLGRRHEV